ncbi:MAG TPA: GNAT family N-acetyltransferase [Candidatus Sulfotelmatobacter sp.]|nr:GNAT family N-acetyltransferase [Candidatus Sulfotelmatobacter sp.]
METVTTPPPPAAPRIAIERLTAFEGSDINDICDAAEAAVVDGGGFGWLKAPPRHVFENYWRGVLLVPERQLFVGRLDGVIGGAAQLVRPARNNEAQAHAATLTGHFVAPWARGHGLARGLTATVEEAARAAGFRVLNLDVRESQTPAIAMYEARGFVRWGTHPRYALVDGAYVAGHFYTKEL